MLQLQHKEMEHHMEYHACTQKSCVVSTFKESDYTTNGLKSCAWCVQLEERSDKVFTFHM